MKMTPELWSKVKFFTLDEKWGDPAQMEMELIYKLDIFRHKIHQRFIVHCGFETEGRSENSQHYVGVAVDGHVSGVDLLDMFLVAEKLEFKGIGLYDWGIHLDERAGDPARWCFINGVEKPLNAQNIDFLREVYRF